MSKKSWLILNVNDEARECAKKMAKLERKPMGKWISDYILKKESQNISSTSPTNNKEDLEDIKKALKAIYNEVHAVHIELNNLQITSTSKGEITHKNKFLGKWLG